MPKQPPKFIRFLCLLICLVAGLSAVAGAVFLAVQGEWVKFPFEVVAALTCFFGVLVGLGRFRDAPALTMLIVAGVLFTGAAIVEDYIGSKLLGQGASPTELAGVRLLPIALARIGVAAAMAALAAITVLIRNPGASFPALARGVAFGIPLLGVSAVFVVPSIRNNIMGMHGGVAAAILTACGLAILVLASIAGHNLIGAFAAGCVRADEQVEDDPAAAAAA